MKDDLEKFIWENRSKMDNLEAPVDSFNKISSRLEQQKSIKTISFTRSQLFRVAASFAVPVLLSYFVIGYLNHQKIDRITAESATCNEETSPVLYDLIETENYYQSAIDKVKTEIYQKLGEDPELVREIETILNDIDRSYNVYNSDLNENVNSEQIASALITCQRTKLQALEDIQNQINDQNQTK